jgi:TonB family protein
MAWPSKVAMVLSVGIAAAQQSPVIVDPEDELLAMLREWRQQSRGNALPSEPSPASAAAAEASTAAGTCLINGKAYSPCPTVKNTTGRDEHSPAVLSSIPPEYPALAAASGVRGRVVVLVTIDENGIPRDPKVISASASDAGGQSIQTPKTFGFEAAALAAVRNWIFAPGTKDGTPTSAKLVIEVSFPPHN